MKGGQLKPVVETPETPLINLNISEQDVLNNTEESGRQENSADDLESESCSSESEIDHLENSPIEYNLPDSEIPTNQLSENSLQVNIDTNLETNENDGESETSSISQTKVLPNIIYKKWTVNLVNKCPNQYITIKTEINGKTVTSLLDTGASINLITESTAKLLNLEINLHEKSCIYGIGGKDVQSQTLGTVLTPIQIHKLKFPSVYFHVVQDSCIDEQIFIGYDFLKAYNLTVNLHRKCIKYIDKNTKSQWDLYLDPEGYKLVFHRLVCHSIAKTSFQPDKTEFVKVGIKVNYPKFVVPEFINQTDEMYLFEGLTGEAEDNHLKCVNRTVQGSVGIINLRDPWVWFSASEPGKKVISVGDVIGRVSTVVKVDSPITKRPVNVASISEEKVDIIGKKLKLGSHLSPEQKD